MNKNRKKTLCAELGAMVVFLTAVILVVLVFVDPGYNRYANAINPYFILKADHIQEEAIQDYSGVQRTYTFTLPEADSATTTGARLTVYLRHTLASFTIEDSTYTDEPFEKSTDYIGKTPGNYWVSIPVRPVYAGKTVKVTLVPVYESVRNEEPLFMIINRDMLLNMIELPKDRLVLILSLMAVTAGFFLCLMVLGMPMEVREKQRIFCIGAITVTAGIWKLCALPSILLLLDYINIQKGLWFTGASCYILMLVLSLRLFTLIREEDSSGIRTGMVCYHMSAAFAALILILQLTRVVELHDVLIWYGIGSACLHLISLFGQKPSRSELLWLFPFFLTLGADLGVYLITGTMRSTPFFLIWIVLNLFIRGFGFVRSAILKERLLRKQEEEIRDTRVQALINQIRPHFIYNTLTSVYVLCREDPKLAMQVIQDFTTYLQHNFSAISAKDPVSFTDELSHTKAYVAVESLRYGDKLLVEYVLDFTTFRIPPLTLQPLVENAIKHCLGKGNGPEHIIIHTWMEDGNALISVEDDGPGFDPKDTDSEVHVGLKNVKERLELMCNGTLEVTSNVGKGTLVTVSIPQNKSEYSVSDKMHEIPEI